MPDKSKQCNITNISGWDIMVALAITADETTSSDAVVAANGQLEILKTGGGGTVIKNGSSDTVILDHSYKAISGGNGYVPGYDLQVCDSTWAYPVANLPVVQQKENGSTGYAAQTIPATDSVMNSAVNFYQTIASYPDSGLAKNYIAAIQKAQEMALEEADGSPESAKAISFAISDTMKGFFKGTQEYKDLTLADVVAVGNYYDNFPAVWAKYQDTFTYYLYGSDGETASFAGTLSLRKSGALDVTKAGGGYTCSFVPAVDPADMDKTDVDTSKTVTLTYTDGLFVDDPKAEVPKIGLRGSFLLRRLLTNDATDKKIVTVVAGTINGSTTVGLDTPQRSSEAVHQSMIASESLHDSFIKFWDVLINPKSLKDWAITIMTFVGAVAVIPAMAFAVYRVYKAVTWKPFTDKAPSRETIDDNFNEPVKAVKKQGVKWEGGDEESLARYYDLTLEQVTEIIESATISQALAGAFNIQRVYMQELLPYSSLLSREENRNLQNLIDKISESQFNATKIVDGTVYELPDSLPGRIVKLKVEMGNLRDYAKSFDAIYKRVQHKISEDARETVEESANHISTLAADLEKALDKESEEKSELDPRVEEEIRPGEL